MKYNELKEEDRKDYCLNLLQRLGIGTDVVSIVEDIKEDLQGLKNIYEFKDFVKNNYLKEEYKYLNGIQRFDLLLANFKKPKSKWGDIPKGFY
jgi:hypothetical protein